MSNLATMHRDGRGVPASREATNRWTRAAAEAGHPLSMYNWSVTLQAGLGAPRDDEGAVRWLRRASAAGCLEAHFNLANRFREGRGVARDAVEALRLYVLAAPGDPSGKAHYAAGTLLLGALALPALVPIEAAMGWPLPPSNGAAAAAHFRKAAELGAGDAMYSLGVMHMLGKGVAAEHGEGLGWIKKAVAAGSRAAVDFARNNKIAF
jgi:TPR repeat protein